MKKKGRIMWGFIYVIAFIVVFLASMIFKVSFDPFHGKYKVEWNDSVGKVYSDLSYEMVQQTNLIFMFRQTTAGRTMVW